MARPAAARRRGRELPRLIAVGAPALVAAVGSLAWLIAGPPSGDLAAQLHRVQLFAAHGFSVWDGNWYAGHHTGGYSVLFPPLAWLTGTRVAGALSAVAAAALFAALARRHLGPAALAGSVWFGAAVVIELLTGRMTFMLGVAIGLAALLVRSPAPAALLGVACAAASPVAALFLALAGFAARRWGLVAAPLLTIVVLAFAFPEGGYEPFTFASLVPLLILCPLFALVVSQPALRTGALLYTAGALAAFLIHTPVGSNVLRLGPLVGGPLLACAFRTVRYRALAVALLAGFLWWQWGPTAGDVAGIAGDPATRPAYYAPLVSALERAGGPPGRVEIPFTKAHWEADVVAARFPLARGWERQLDIARDGLFYGGTLSAATYRRWLDERAVRWVAVPDARLDKSGIGEARLVERGLPYLRLRWRSRHWRLYEVTDPGPFVSGAAIRLVRLSDDHFVFGVRRPGRARVAVAWSPYWRLSNGCVSRAGDWTEIQPEHSGTARLEMSFSLTRVFERGRRCA